jgi:hypothetical protein
MNAAMLAESVLGGPGVELVGGQLTLPAEKLELLPRHYKVQKSLFAADRAIAFGDTVQ